MFSFAYVLITATVILLTYLINNHFKNKRFWKLLDAFPGEKPLPIIGNAHQFGSTSEELIKTRNQFFKNAGYKSFKVQVGNKGILNLVEPETVEVMLSSTKEITKSDEYLLLKGWLGDGLLLSTGQKWRQRRKIITPTFHFKILEEFVQVFNDNGKILIEQLAKQKGAILDIYPFINRYALDVICDTAMGVNINAQTDTESSYVKAVHSICNLTNMRMMSPWKRNNWLYSMSSSYKTYEKNIKQLHKMTQDVIKIRRNLLKDQIDKVRIGEELKENQDEFGSKKKKTAFLDLLLLSKLPDGSFLSDEDIREETDTFMFEGHDTTTSAMSFALYSLANYPEVQEKVLEEIISIVGTDPNVEITYDHLQNMKYMDMVIKETLRLYPSVTAYGRRLENDLKLPDGKIIPSGCNVIVDAYLLGRNPRYHEDPDKFDPERFSTENTAGKNPYMTVPFSAGSRNCIGQKFAMLEIKSVLTKVLLNYELVTAGEEAKPRLASELIMKSVNGINLIIKNRQL